MNGLFSIFVKIDSATVELNGLCTFLCPGLVFNQLVGCWERSVIVHNSVRLDSFVITLYIKLVLSLSLYFYHLSVVIQDYTACSAV